MERWVYRPQDREPACRAGVHAGGRHRASQALAERRRPAAAHEAQSALRAAYTSPPPTLFLGGEIDEVAYRDLLRVLELAAGSQRHLLAVDMADVAYCDLAGLRAIISLTNALPPGSAGVDQLVLHHLPMQLKTVLRVLGWDATPGLYLAEPLN